MCKAPRYLLLLLVLACNQAAPDAPAPADGATADLGTDSLPDAGPPSSTLNCNAAGCAFLPECPGTCQSPCGCCPCGPGYRTCTARDGKPALQACGATGGCWDYTLCPDGGGCVEPEHGKAVCVSSTADCPAIEATYLREVQQYANLVAQPGAASPAANRDYRCAGDGSCTVTAGHCSIGLGACWYVGPLEPAVLGYFASLWQKLGCGAAVSCDCAPLPAAATCPQWGGSCVVR